MTERRNLAAAACLALTAGLIAASLTAVFLTRYYGTRNMRMLGEVCGRIMEIQPKAEEAVAAALKEYREGLITGRRESGGSERVLEIYGYEADDFLGREGRVGAGLGAAGFLVGGLLFWAAFLFLRRGERQRIRSLTGYLERVNSGEGGVLLRGGEDDFSKLQDEIYKTVTELTQTREEAVGVRNNYAENLYNIAHQIKTPLTSMSLAVQMMEREPDPKHLGQIRRQISRLTYLEEALLLLSRIDAGALSMERREVDVLTVLVLAADNLQELLSAAEVSVEIPEAGEVLISADLDWTMEAVMNLLKNCAEHTPPGGVVHCSYERNPLYVQIRIWDEGAGFAREDIPRLFERFYRGQGAGDGGIGIGLALSKAIIERQRGTVTARNQPEGGACFEIRFYCH